MVTVMKKTKKLAVSAILCALGVTVMLVGMYTAVLDMSAVVFASLLIMMAVIELGGVYPYLIWLVTGTLSVILMPSQLGGILYFAFGGIYPIFKAMFERLHYVVSWILKLSFFNTSLTVCVLLTKYILKIEDPIGFDAIVYLLGNAAFVVYDLAATGMVTVYLVKLRRRLGLGNYFK